MLHVTLREKSGSSHYLQEYVLILYKLGVDPIFFFVQTAIVHCN